MQLWQLDVMAGVVLDDDSEFRSALRRRDLALVARPRDELTQDEAAVWAALGAGQFPHNSE